MNVGAEVSESWLWFLIVKFHSAVTLKDFLDTKYLPLSSKCSTLTRLSHVPGTEKRDKGKKKAPSGNPGSEIEISSEEEFDGKEAERAVEEDENNEKLKDAKQGPTGQMRKHYHLPTKVIENGKKKWAFKCKYLLFECLALH